MAYRSSSSSGGSTTTVTVAVPAGAATDDIAILAISADSGSLDTYTWPTGFTSLGGVAIASPDGQTFAFAWKRLTGADSGNYVTTLSVTGGDHLAECALFSGRHTTNPPVASTIATDTNANSSPISVSATGVTAVAGDDLVWIGAADATAGGGGTSWSPPSTFTERKDDVNAGPGGGWANGSLATSDNVSAGATGTITGVFTATVTAGWLASLVRIPAAPASGAYTLTAAAGSYTLTGTAATLLHKYVVSATAGAYTLTGTAATLRRNLPLVAGAGSYALTGTAASLLHKYVLTAAAGSYALTGTAATLKHGFAVAAGAGSYALTGTAASLRKTWLLGASAGSYLFTGTAATLTYLSGKTVIAGAGSYNLTGTAATLLHKYIVTAGAGSYALSGVTATLKHGFVVTVGAGSYVVTGSAATLRRTWLLSGGAGSYVLSGSAAALTHGGVAGLSSSGVRRLRAAHEADDKEAHYREVRRREALQVQQIRLAELQEQQRELEAKQALDAAQRQEAQVRRPKGKAPAVRDRVSALVGELAEVAGAVAQTQAEIARLDAIEAREALQAEQAEQAIDDETILILAASI